ncbi:MAG: ATP-binding protein [Steroidobacteraceae bacterium]
MGWLRGLRLSIFGRSFLLTLASLLIAECVGVALFATQPVSSAAYLSVADLARSLVSTDRIQSRDDSLAPDEDLQTPRSGVSSLSSGPPSGPPPDDRFESLEDLRKNWHFKDATSAPAAPPDTDAEASQRLTAVLATRIGAQPDHVRLNIRKPGFSLFGSGSDASSLLRRGFVAGWQQSPGHWRVIESGPSDSPDIFNRQALLLFALGLLTLLPLSWMFARALSRPISRFADAARHLGTDPYGSVLEREGPPEMLVAIDSFNAMQGRLMRLLQERSQMVGAIAHDLRTPLMRIAFRLDAVEPPLKEKIEADLQEMKLMIAAALDYVRDQSLGGARQKLDFRLLVESVVDDQHDVGHDVTMQGGEPVIVHGDSIALRRAISNVVDNALKYGERARLRLRSAENECTLEIDDDGPGIPESMRERVFEPFFRTEASRNRDTGGIGLGLTIVRSVVLDHGGSVQLRNRKDRGLRVIIALPLMAG